MKEKAINILKILGLMLLAYVVMVFISHFSVYNQSETYTISDSFKAMIFKTDVPAQFLIYFGLHIFIVVLIALGINFFGKKIIKKK